MDIAEYILSYCNKNDILISNFQLQKILYYLQCYFVVFEDRALFEDNIHAYDFGVAVDDVYKRFCMYGAGSIFYRDSDKGVVDECDKKYMNGIIDDISKFSNPSLNDIMFKQYPIMRAMKTRDRIITIDSIKKYYSD